MATPTIISFLAFKLYWHYETNNRTTIYNTPHNTTPKVNLMTTVRESENATITDVKIERGY